MKEIKQLKVGDVLSESSHYVVQSIDGSVIHAKHFESGDTVRLGNEYISGYVESADEVVEEVKVTKEDKRDGTKGIRSIFEGIHTPQVFTVCFKKQDKPKTKKTLQKEIDYLVNQFCADIDKVKSSKKGVAERAKTLVTEFIKEPILPYEQGEDRVLRGFKIQFESRDGRYNCVDMDIDGEDNIRPVNINTIKWLQIGGTKYIVE
jgi:hypothetical protein